MALLKYLKSENVATFKWVVRTPTKTTFIKKLRDLIIRLRSFGLPVCYPKIQRSIILPVVLYGCETWYFMWRKEHGLRLLENRVLRKIIKPRRDEVTGEWRKLHMIYIYIYMCVCVCLPYFKIVCWWTDDGSMMETCSCLKTNDSCSIF
jgi:hypothetical protein